MIHGVSLHANVAVPARDRKRLERLCRYVARPPVSTARLIAQSDGRLRYALKRRWRDGTTHVVFEPSELLERLVALIPPPRAHQVRYHGVLAPAAADRAAICTDRRVRQRGGTHSRSAGLAHGPDPSGVRKTATTDARPVEPNRSRHPARSRGSLEAGRDVAAVDPPSSTAPRARRLAWSALIQRVFARDVLECPSCGGHMRVIAAIEQPEIIAAILRCLGLASRGPPIAPARSAAELFLEPHSEFAAPADDLTPPPAD